VATTSGKKVALSQFRDKCAELGLKVTPQRTAIYEQLYRSKEHPTADAVYRRVRKKLPNISFDTVNRTLVTFSKQGIIRVVEGYGEAKRFDPDLEPHHHFRCIRCNGIVDFQEQTFDELDVPKNIREQFKVLHKKVVLEGVCESCQKVKE
jgi:Fur family peroxide stress response transcriptional regulator